MTPATLDLANSSRFLDRPLTHPMDSSQALNSLLAFVRESAHTPLSGHEVSIVSVPTLRRLLSAIHFRDAVTLKHSRRVGLISVGIATRLGWDDFDLRIIEIAALLHDVGKIGIPDHILRKPGKLTPDEADFISVHQRVGLMLLQACQVHPDVTDIIAQAHGLEQEDFQLRNALGQGARILAVADAYDSLTTRQAYRAPFDRWEALQILDEQSGKHFDRNVVAALGRWLDSPDAADLADERAAEVSIQVNAPVDVETRLHSLQLCLVFNHLYLLETLYDAYYLIDANRKVVIWNSGAAAAFQLSAKDVLQEQWSRQQVSPLMSSEDDPLEMAFATGRPHCASLTVHESADESREMEAQAIPLHADDGSVQGVLETICDAHDSKKHRGQFRSLQIAATRDPLTGVLNRGELERRLHELHEHVATSPDFAYTVIFLDLDHFKSINDRLSHQVGDRVLIETARLLQDELYSSEIIGRYGGEEFMMICPETSIDTAIERAERLRRAIMSSRFADRDDLRVTASLGVAQIQPGEAAEDVCERADQALYDAKNQGRNRTCHRKHAAAAVTRKEVGTGNTLSQTATIVTCVGLEILQLKLTGFIEQQQAKLLEVSPDTVSLQFGSTGLLGSLARGAERLPLKMSIHIQTNERSGPHPIANRQTLRVVVEPLKKSSQDQQFRQRANHLVEALRSHLLADADAG